MKKELFRLDKKTNITIGLVLSLTVLITIGAVTYAFTSMDGLPNEPIDATASTAELKLRYTDCANDDVSTCSDISSDLEPGQAIEKVFSIKNVGSKDLAYAIVFRELTSTFVDDELVYKLENITTNTVIVDETPIPNGTNDGLEMVTKVDAPIGTTQRYKLTIIYLNKDYNQVANQNAEFSMKIGITNPISKSKKTLEALGVESNGLKDSFDTPATTDEGIFEMEDDYGTSYYYRGAVENNYVKYGVNAAGQEMWWRIIRVNGDGSLRIVYDGTQGYANGTSNDDRFAKVSQVFNITRTDAKYVGWMYGPEGTTVSTSKEQAQSNIASSDAKVYVDQWYKENIVDTGYGNNVSDEIFCNDRSIPGKALSGWSSDTGKGFGSNYTAYGATARTQVWNSKPSAPTFKCPQKNDSFTVSDTEKGNGALDYPVGLITADEIVAVGSGKYGTTNQKYYLYKSSSYYQWSLSPYNWDSYADMFVVNTSGKLNGTNTGYTSGAVAPVINLSTEYASTMVGTGTIADPFRTA